jgi:hypothetical protein
MIFFPSITPESSSFFAKFKILPNEKPETICDSSKVYAEFKRRTMGHNAADYSFQIMPFKGGLAW